MSIMSVLQIPCRGPVSGILSRDRKEWDGNRKWEWEKPTGNMMPGEGHHAVTGCLYTMQNAL